MTGSGAGAARRAGWTPAGPAPRRQPAEPVRRGRADERVGIGRRRLDDRQRGGAGPAQRFDRGRPHDGGQGLVGRHRPQRRLRLPISGAGRRERLGEVRLRRRPPPFGGPVRRPTGRPLRVTLRTGVRRAECRRQVRTRDAEAVIAARVDPHVGPRRHVAAHAARPGRLRVVEVVVRRVVAAGGQRRKPLDRRLTVALETDRVAPRPQPEPVRVVAVRTADARRVHPALDERPPDVDLVLDLPVRVVQARVEPRGQEVVEERTPGAIRLGEALPPGVAAGAGPDLGRGPAGRKIDEQTGRGRRRRPRFRGRARPLDVRRAGSVTRLTADVDRRPGGAIGIAVRVVARAQTGRVTLGAHRVPALVAAGPVQGVVRPDLPVRIEVEPPTALRVPRDRQALQATAGERSQVLLQRLDAEGVGQLEVGESPVRALRVDEEPTVPPEEAGGHAEVGERGVVEVAQHGPRRGLLHGEVVMRAGPCLVLTRVAVGAGRIVDVGHALFTGAQIPARRRAAAAGLDRTGRNDHGAGGNRSNRGDGRGSNVGHGGSGRVCHKRNPELDTERRPRREASLSL